MDNSLSESARFAVYREKLKGICEANNLSYVFIKNAYPIKLVIRPLGGVGEQMSMLEEATEDNYISPGASILFTVKDGNLTYRMRKRPSERKSGSRNSSTRISLQLSRTICSNCAGTL